jgi:hypothetical protein
MLPIILYSLSNSENIEESFIVSSIKSLQLLLNQTFESEEKLFNSYCEDILQRLISLCHYKRNMEVRLISLKCLNNLALIFQPNNLIKHQRYVCKELELCFNDKKRLCRQMAVEARNRWFLLSTKSKET